MSDEYSYQEFPKWAYGPNGEARIFEKTEDIPEGWVDHPSKVKKEIVEEDKKEEEINNNIINNPNTPNETNNPIEPSNVGQQEEQVSIEEMKVDFQKKEMGDLWKMAIDLGIPKNGKKPELIERIIQKIKEVENADKKEN